MDYYNEYLSTKIELEKLQREYTELKADYDALRGENNAIIAMLGFKVGESKGKWQTTLQGFSWRYTVRSMNYAKAWPLSN